MLVIKSFVSLKEWVFAIFDEGTSQGGSEVLKFSSFAFFGVEGGQKRVTSIFQGGADTPENTMMDFLKVIYENVEKKTFILQQSYLYIRVLKSCEVLFYTYCKGLFCFYIAVVQLLGLYSSEYA